LLSSVEPPPPPPSCLFLYITGFAFVLIFSGAGSCHFTFSFSLPDRTSPPFSFSYVLKFHPPFCWGLFRTPVLPCFPRVCRTVTRVFFPGPALFSPTVILNADLFAFSSRASAPGSWSPPSHPSCTLLHGSSTPLQFLHQRQEIVDRPPPSFSRAPQWFPPPVTC